MAKVKAYVYVLVSGTSTLLRPGDEVPEGVTLTNPDVIDGEPTKAPEPKTPETPAADEPETPAADEPEPDPAPKKRAPRKAADS